MYTLQLLLICILLLRTQTAATKRGYALATTNAADLTTLSTNAVEWYYNWSPNPTNFKKEQIPMQWNLANINQIGTKLAANNWTTLLGFNEPDRSDQANITAAVAAANWKQYFEPLHTKGIRLGAPAVSSAPEGAQWLRNFFGNCTGCHVDFLPIHWYGEGVGNLYNYVWSMSGEFKLPIWITEVFGYLLADFTKLIYINSMLQPRAILQLIWLS